jgi:hypothetical protein
MLVAAQAVIGPAGAEPAQSQYIKDVQIDLKTIRKFADESDNFHLTWHPDGGLYGAYGDGWGFVRTDIPKRAIGVSRITGTPPNLSGTDVWEGDAQGGTCCWKPWNGKSWGMIAIDRTLHMWFTIGRPRALGFLEARLATSTDGGASWRKANWAFTPADRMLMPTFMQVGQGYRSGALPGEIMNYAYSFHTQYVRHPSNVQSPGRVLLMRSPKRQVTSRDAYEFFAGTTAGGAPIWTRDLGKRVPVLEKPHILDVAPAVAWNPHLGRFIMVMGHVPAGKTANRGVGFYEAERPWGPWFKIKEIDQFLEGTIFFFQFPTKWMSADRSAWMAFTGIDKAGGQEWDALDIVKTRFVLANGSPPPGPVYEGCFADIGGTDNLSAHDLDGLFFQDGAMTVGLCTSTCRDRGFRFAGARNGFRCFCGDNADRKFGPATTCTSKCYGDGSQICGGYSVNSVYRLP